MRLTAPPRTAGVIAALACLLILAACGARRAGDVSETRLERHDGRDGTWITAGNGWRGAYASPLTQINTGNVDRLGFAWSYDVGQARGQEATPLVVDGIMYVSTNWGHVAALDAATGKEIWTYDPKVDGQWGRYACCDVVNRGVSVFEGVVFVGSTDNFLHAVDAGTGKLIWKADILDPEARARHTPYTSSGIPQVAGDVVVIGNGGADFGVRGFVRAFDRKTGARRWTFYTVPHDPRRGPQEKPYLDAALKTWDPQTDWSYGGGGTVWDGMSYDPELHLLYIGTGNSSPYNYLDRSKGHGDNLYLASIVAIDPKTGDMRWHYQTVPGEFWDYTATEKMILADLTIGGRVRRVLMQAPKNGFFYVLDRETGALISATPYTFQNWASGIDPKTGRARINPAANYLNGPKLIYPSMAGGHNWQPMAFNAATGLVYIPVIDAPMVFIETKHLPIGTLEGAFTTAGIFPEGYAPEPMRRLFGPLPSLDDLAKTAGGPGRPKSQGFIRAFDPVSGRIRWQSPTESFSDGGVMTTASNLLFSGDVAGRLVVRRADTGAVLRKIDTGSSIMAAPMTYLVKNEQYVAVLAGLGGGGGGGYPPNSAAYKYGNEGRVLVFKLGGGPAPIPPELPPDRFESPPSPPPFTAADAVRGEAIFNHRCARCHGEGRGLIPDLRRITPATHGLFSDIVLKGLKRDLGMASFADVLNEKDVAAIHAYVSREQLALYAREKAAEERHGAADAKPSTLLARHQ